MGLLSKLGAWDIMLNGSEMACVGWVTGSVLGGDRLR